MNEEIFYNKIYEKTKDCGRTQFVRLLMDKERENQELKKQLHDASIQIQEMIEQDIECPSNCSKLKELKKRLEVGEKQYNDVVEKMEKQKEVIDKAIEYINEYAWKEDIIGDMYTVTGKLMVDKYMQLEWDNCKELLDILSEVE